MDRYLEFDYDRLRKAYNKEGGYGVPLEFLIKRASLDVWQILIRFLHTYVCFRDLNPDPESEIVVSGKLGRFNDKTFNRTGFRYLISIDPIAFNKGHKARRTILHELRHAHQDMAGYDIFSANVNKRDELGDYINNPLEKDAREHESLARWFK